LKISLSSAGKGLYPAGHLQKDFRGYVLSYFLVKEPVNAEFKDAFIIQFVKPAEGIGIGASPKD
jgi:hypothetical protein